MASQPVAPGPESALPPMPVPDELSLPFWNGLAAGELRFQRCTACSVRIHPPEPFCPACGAGSFEYEPVPLSGTVHSYVVMRDARVRGYADRVPYVNVWAEMDAQADLLLLANLADADAGDIRIGSRVIVGFERVSDELTLPVFRLDRRAG